MNKLEHIVEFGKEWAVPVIGAVAAVALLEYSGVSGFVQDFGIEITRMKRQYFGDFIGNIAYYSTFVGRGAFDLMIGALGAGYIHDKINK